MCGKRKSAPVVALFLYPSPHSLPRVYRRGLLWQPQKWPVRALGNVDVQIMTCWKPRTTGLSPAGNWFFSQFIVSICTVHRWFSHFRSRGWAGREEDRCKYGISPREIGGRCMLANVHMHVHIHKWLYCHLLGEICSTLVGWKNREIPYYYTFKYKEKTQRALYFYVANEVSNFAAEQINS